MDGNDKIPKSLNKVAHDVFAEIPDIAQIHIFWAINKFLQ